MPAANAFLTHRSPKVVGSFCNASSLQSISLQTVREQCDVAEIRLDLLSAEEIPSRPWSHLSEMTLLFTARREEEGGGRPLDAATRSSLLENVLDQAAFIDIEVASIEEMPFLIELLADRQLPWIASYHDFEQIPSPETLAANAMKARDAGASVFKCAAMLAGPADVAALADFQLADHGIPVATMGMGPLAAVSRLLCAQSGSVLNYGYLGEAPTAPGQWDAAFLKQAITRLASLRE